MKKYFKDTKERVYFRRLDLLLKLGDATMVMVDIVGQLAYTEN